MSATAGISSSAARAASVRDPAGAVQDRVLAVDVEVDEGLGGHRLGQSRDGPLTAPESTARNRNRPSVELRHPALRGGSGRRHEPELGARLLRQLRRKPEHDRPHHVGSRSASRSGRRARPRRRRGCLVACRHEGPRSAARPGRRARAPARCACLARRASRFVAVGESGSRRRRGTRGRRRTSRGQSSSDAASATQRSLGGMRGAHRSSCARWAATSDASRSLPRRNDPRRRGGQSTRCGAGCRARCAGARAVPRRRRASVGTARPSISAQRGGECVDLTCRRRPLLANRSLSAPAPCLDGSRKGAPRFVPTL